MHFRIFTHTTEADNDAKVLAIKWLLEAEGMAYNIYYDQKDVWALTNGRPIPYIEISGLEVKLKGHINVYDYLNNNGLLRA